MVQLFVHSLSDATAFESFSLNLSVAKEMGVTMDGVIGNVLTVAVVAVVVNA